MVRPSTHRHCNRTCCERDPNTDPRLTDPGRLQIPAPDASPSRAACPHDSGVDIRVLAVVVSRKRVTAGRGSCMDSCRWPVRAPVGRRARARRSVCGLGRAGRCCEGICALGTLIECRSAAAAAGEDGDETRARTSAPRGGGERLFTAAGHGWLSRGFRGLRAIAGLPRGCRGAGRRLLGGGAGRWGCWSRASIRCRRG